jgi:phage terminase large subunit-like protein
VKRVAKRWIRNPSDELAVREGCYFDLAAGMRVCEFIETYCRQSKGKWGGEPLKLLAWQRDFLMRLFGWKRPDGNRRFARAYLEVAKKNGKSTLISAIALYLLIADGEPGPEIYLNAVDREQARIVFDESAKMVRAHPELEELLDIIDSRHRIVFAESNGLIRCNSSDAPSKDGLNPHGIIFDELHRQPNFDLVNIFEHADSAREQPLWVDITTAGEDESGPWFERRDYCEKVNRGELPDTTVLGVIYRADPDDDIDDPATWAKANPSLGQTVSLERFKLRLADAKENPRKLAEFLRLRLNIVSKADTIFIQAEDWKACDSPRLDPATLVGTPCYLGADLSRTTDLTAVVALWGDQESGFDMAAWFYLPLDNVKALTRRDRVPYDAWIREKWITATPGSIIDYAYVRRDINALAAAHDIRTILCDPYNATQLLTELRDEDGLPVAEIRQGFLSLSAPTKELERLVKGRKLRHGGNPVMRWMIGNAVAEQDAAGNLKLSKRKSRLKIDGPAALVNAIAAACAGDPAAEVSDSPLVFIGGRG